MMTPTALTTRPERLPAIRTASARKYAKRSKAQRTLNVYAAAWAEFRAFADKRGEPVLPASPAMVIDYLTGLADAGAKASTIGVKLAAIAWVHRSNKHADPTVDEEVKMVMAGIRRAVGIAPQKKAPATLDEIRRMVAALDLTKPAGMRDKALLLIGFGGAFRRSELVALDVSDVRMGEDLRIIVRRSKTDQEGKGVTKVIPSLRDESICPVRALQAWLDMAGIRSGAVFRRVDRWGNVRKVRLTAQSVALIVKSAARRAGLDARPFSGHSLRSGFITEASNAGVETRDIMSQTGHRSERVMRDYIQDAGRGARAAAKAAFREKNG